MTTGTVATAQSVGEDPISGMLVRYDHNIITGVELAPEVVRYLDESLRGRTEEQRRDHLEEIDPQAFQAWTLRSEHRTHAEIAQTMGCTTKTVQRALLRAARILSPTPLPEPDSLSYGERERLLRQRDPGAYSVWSRQSYGSTLAAISDQLGISIGAAHRRSVRARQFMGEDDRAGRRARRFMHAVTYEDATDVPTEVIVERQRQRELECPVAGISGDHYDSGVEV
jgi:DNA-directed RNA polymerase specialized sigma24 family protein